ncbi:class I SAM-dependent methyltransferase [Blastococcus haudaquaticus]|uniref:Methyltransferase domain-containing protein n=1 Tax=Blastococcus haudaquaticus TaxID=1938745 RepID=A0A286H302_9ACTN|nr:class I SAM-dependent methyltransferase [Blastococcus haudaquaticus]SOE02180.1 Methyltransferase domain-containing protein [Blastococcus haudaquaticus]
MTVPAPQPGPLVDEANAEQFRAWNGDEVQHWVTHIDRYEAASARFDPWLLTAAGLTATDRVLDVGCGAGRSSNAAARAAVDGHVVGLDLSAPLLALARRRAEAAGLTNATFVQGDAQVHPFQPAAFDVVLSRFGVMFFGDPSAAFANIATAVRPGGRLAMLVWQGMDRNEWLGVLFETLAAGRPLPAPAAGAPGPFGLADPDTVQRVLTDAGFVDVDLADVREPERVGADVDDAYAFMTSLGPTKGLLGGLDERARTAALDLLRNRLADRAGPDGVLLGAAAWLVTARRGDLGAR